MLQLKHFLIFTLIAPVMLETCEDEKIQFHPEIDDAVTNGMITIDVNGNLSSCTVTSTKGKIINTLTYVICVVKYIVFLNRF